MPTGPPLTFSARRAKILGRILKYARPTPSHFFCGLLRDGSKLGRHTRLLSKFHQNYAATQTGPHDTAPAEHQAEYSTILPAAF